MDIHVRGSIEFEKILDYTFTNAISLTRQRIAIQQFLDQKDEESTDSDHQQLIRHLTTYGRAMQSCISKLSGTNITIQPCFSWSINHEPIQSACWVLEAIMPNIVNLQLQLDLGHKSVEQENYKQANKYYKKAHEIPKETEILNRQWKWKIPSMNHKICSTSWHIAQQYYTECLQQLCTISVGIQSETNDKSMYTLAQRTLRSAALSYAHWKTDEVGKIITLSDGLRYLYSSNILWNREEYGQSIYRLEHWLQKTEIDPQWPILKREFEKINFLLQERRHTNEGAYFETIGPARALPDLPTIIHTKNIKHPEKGMLQNQDNQPSNQQNLNSALLTTTSLPNNP